MVMINQMNQINLVRNLSADRQDNPSKADVLLLTKISNPKG